MTFLGPGKTGRFWLKLRQEIPGTETLLCLCCCRTPKLDAPSRASRGFRNFCCVLQLTQSHCFGSFWVQLCMAGTQPGQHQESPGMVELYRALCGSSSPEIWAQSTALLTQAGQQAPINKAVIEWFSLICWFSLIREILPGVISALCKARGQLDGESAQDQARR